MPESPIRYVLVTGSDSGIGRATVARLTQAGYQVLAGCLGPADYWGLPADAHRRLHTFALDVTSPASRDAALATATGIVGDAGLYALVNNAGIALGGPVEAISPATWTAQFQVNVLGTAAMTQTFLPLLRRAPQARVINVGSICGLVSFPFSGPYCASKHAVDAITMALRGELRPWGIQAAVVVPGLVNTRLWDAVRETTTAQVAHWNPSLQAYYADRVMRRLDRTCQRARHGISADHVALKIRAIAGQQRLRPRYFVGNDARLLFWADRLLPRWRLTRPLRHFWGLPG